MAFNVPNLNFNQPTSGGIYTDAASMFMAQARAAAQLRLQKQQAELAEREQAHREKAAEANTAALNRQTAATEEKHKFDREVWEAKQADEARKQQLATVQGVNARLDPESENFDPALGEAEAAIQGVQIQRPQENPDAPMQRADPDAVIHPALGTPTALAIAMPRRKPKPQQPVPTEDDLLESEATAQKPVDTTGRDFEAEMGALEAAVPEVPQQRGVSVDVGGGRTVRLDPERKEQARNIENAKWAAKIRSLAGTGAGPIKGAYFDAAATLVEKEAVPGEKAFEVAAGFLGRDDRYAMAEMNALAAMGRAQMAAKNRQTITPHQEVIQDQGWATKWDAAYDRWEKQRDVDKLSLSYDNLQTLTQQMAAYDAQKDIVSLKSVLFKTAREIVGVGVLTDAEFNNTVQGTAGLFASFMSKMEKGLNGDVNEAEVNAMRKFVRNSNRILREKAVGAVKNFDARYRNSTWVKRAADDVAASREGLLDRFGLSDADVDPQKAAADSAAEAKQLINELRKRRAAK